MNTQDLVTEIGDMLTQVDATLASPDADPGSAAWQQLFALRKHLDDQQRALVQQQINADDEALADLTKKLKSACDDMDALQNDFRNINQIIGTVADAAGMVDGILKLV